MDYNRIMQEILNIGEELLKSGAEIFRVEDSLYRMCRSYGFVRSDVYASQINIQMTVETPEGEIITQIRYIEMISPHYDKLDQLNNLSRYVCANTPKQAEIHERYEKIAKSKVLAFPPPCNIFIAKAIPNAIPRAPSTEFIISRAPEVKFL